MDITQLDHVAIHVADVEKSCRFYEEVLGLSRIPRPDFDFPGAWFRLGAEQELHLIGGREENFPSASRGNHYALSVESMADVEERLKDLDRTFSGPRARPDGAMQIFLSDPDGHVIELCTAPGIS